MSPEQREADLSRRSAEKRAVLESKLREFDQLSPSDREQRLRALRQRLMLTYLIRLPADSRLTELGRLQSDERAALEAPLRQWDQMPADLKDEVLQSEWAIRVLVQPQSAASVKPGEENPELTRRINHWQSLTWERRAAVVEQFSRFFEELTPGEQAKVVAAAKPESRDALTANLQTFNQMAPEQREACLTNLQRFAQLSPAERQQFLMNAAIWDKMTDRERESWRRIVIKFNPRQPLPPVPVPHLPPLPPLVNPDR
jgi:hypothetical protein